jgi:hypothetical protein
MKKFFVVFAFFLSINANASLISFEANQASYNDGDTVLVDIFLNSANPALEWLEAELLFDDSLFSFEQFAVTGDVWFNTWYDDGFTNADLLIIQIGFLADWIDELGTSFKLGQAEFTAIGDGVTFGLSTADIYAEDAYYEEISAQQVPEPSIIALLGLAGLFLVKRSKKC